MVFCYSLNSIISSHVSRAFSYTPVYAVVIGVSVSVGIVVVIAGVGGGIVVIIVVIVRRDKKKKEVGGSGLNPAPSTQVCGPITIQHTSASLEVAGLKAVVDSAHP